MRKVLVVEDDKLISAIFVMFLRELGHDLVGRCTTGKEAVELSHRLKPDVVLMDIHLDGDMDGIQTAEQLRRELDIPVIYISSDTSSQVIKRAIVSNSYGYLVKPINKKELGIGIDLAFYKHRVDREQRERERGYRQFISEAPMPIMILQNGKIQYLNNLALEVFKTHYMEDVLTMPYFNFVDQESKSMILPLITNFEENGQGFNNIKVKMLDVHGQVLFVRISGSSIIFNKKKSLQVTIVECSQPDHTQQLSEMKEILDRVSIPYFITDAFLKIESNNQKDVFKETDLAGIELSNESNALFEVCMVEEEPAFQYLQPDGGKKTFIRKVFKSEMGDPVCFLFYGLNY